MSSPLRAVLLLLIVVSCGQTYSAPRDLENACSIVAERPTYLRAMKRSETRWGVPVAVQMAIIHQESRFVGNARTPFRYAAGVIPLGRQSSAYGFSQAIDQTWNDYRSETGRRTARRENIADATDFMGWYIDGTTQRLGIPKGDARDQYLAYHEGRGGFARGGHRSKAWLVGVAQNVQTRAVYYDLQLRSCGRG